ncbi:MAG: DUF2442 domain-containing protein [Nitrospirota bacterium]
MYTSEAVAAAKRVWFDNENMWLELTDGRQLSVPLAYFPRLLHATAEQRQNYEMSGGGTGIHWEEIDEDISVSGLLLGIGDRTKVRAA